MEDKEKRKGKRIFAEDQFLVNQKAKIPSLKQTTPPPPPEVPKAPPRKPREKSTEEGR